MGKITKVIQAKHWETMSPWLKRFVMDATKIPLPSLIKHLDTFPTAWPFPRGDLYHWIPLLNRFDNILQRFCQVYQLTEGFQARDIALDILLAKVDDLEYGGEAWSISNLEKNGYTEHGDEKLIVEILKFTAVLLEHCGNRSIYASSAHLNDLLNSTSLSILLATLRVGSELAQRYQASVKRIGNNNNRQLSAALLANHYNIDLGKVQEIALPFAKTPVKTGDLGNNTGAVTPAASKKPHRPQSTTFANDLVRIAAADSNDWSGWGDIKVTYYPKPSSQSVERTQPSVSTPTPAQSTVPNTPTPLRRSTSAYHPQTPRNSRVVSADDASPITPRNVAAAADDATSSSSSAQKHFELTQSVVAKSSVSELMSRIPADAPDATRFEILHRFRVAKALLDSTTSRQQILGIRLLAITNLAYIHNESAFLEKVLRHDHDETRRFQLVYQLAELVRPQTDDNRKVPLWIQSLSFSLLEPISAFNVRCSDVLSALNASVNHGILLYVIRKSVAEMKNDAQGDITKLSESDEWRNSMFSLTMHLSMTTRAGNDMAPAGLVEILVEILNLRSNTAQRDHYTILAFVDNLIWSFQNAFQAFFAAKGLDAVADLVVSTVTMAQQHVAQGRGTDADNKSQSIDYEIPWYQQQTLKWLLRFIHHVMTNSLTYGGNTDRLLRNLTEKPDLLNSLKEIMENTTTFGSTVWTSTVTILSDFINNDPMSFAALSEAQVIKSYLQAITGQPDLEFGKGTSNAAMNTDADNQAEPVIDADTRPHPPTAAELDAPRQHPIAGGILPSADAINVIPQVLTAIALNSTGLEMIVKSNSLERFLEIFESAPHIRCVQNELNLAHNLGAHFDELARHHPLLRTTISNAVLDMVARVCHLGQTMAKTEGWGAKLVSQDSVEAKPLVVGEQAATVTASESDSAAQQGGNDTDVEMVDVAEASGDKPSSMFSKHTTPITEMTPYIVHVSTFLMSCFANSHIKDHFIQRGGIELLLDFAQTPSLPASFGGCVESTVVSQVIATLIERSPVVGLLSLLTRIQGAVDVLAPIVECEKRPYFLHFINEASDVSLENTEAKSPDLSPQQASTMTRALLQIQVLLRTLVDCFATSPRSVTVQFLGVNAYDYYIRLVDSLGPLLPALLAEQNAEADCVPQHWCLRRNQTSDRRPSGSPGAAVDPSTEDVFTSNIILNDSDLVLDEEARSKRPSKQEQSSVRYQNFMTLRRLLMPILFNTFPLLKTMGKALFPRRERDAFSRSRHLSLAKGIANCMLEQLKTSVQNPSPTHRDFHMWTVMLQTIHEIINDRSRSNERTGGLLIMPVILAFKQEGGFEVLASMVDAFSNEVCKTNKSTEIEEISKGRLASFGLRRILELYAMLVNGRQISDSTAQFGLQRSQERRDPSLGSVLVMELRQVILPVVVKLWNDNVAEKTSGTGLNRMLEILRTFATGDYETSESTKIPDLGFSQTTPTPFFWDLARTNVKKLVEEGCEKDLAIEALYRSSGHADSARDYCKAHKDGLAGKRHPVPSQDAFVEEEPPAATQASSASQSDAMVVDTPAETAPAEDLDRMMGDTELEDLATDTSQTSGGESNIDSERSSSPNQTVTGQPRPAEGSAEATTDDWTTLEAIKKDLDDLREDIRDNLIDHSLDVISVHPQMAVEIHELIKAWIFNAPNNEDGREDVGLTLVNALASLADEEDQESNGGRIAAYAHLMALLLQDKQFFNCCTETLREKVDEYLGFLKVSHLKSQTSLPPWISYILLITELLLAHDEQPVEAQWTFPSPEDETVKEPVLQLKEPIINDAQRGQLMDCILEILPRIGKEETLATSVLRVLVILTRNRLLAQRLGDKKNLQRLFVMAKQMVVYGAVRLKESKFSSNLMIILRHIVEDEENIKQIMRAEIRGLVESCPRHQRSLDLDSYIRALAPVALRSPRLFVDVTNEMLRFPRWSFATPNGGNHPLELKEEATKEDTEEQQQQQQQQSDTNAENLSVQDMQDSIQDIKESTEDKEMPDAPRVSPEIKRPVVENPDGVIHFLLCELLNYREVEDKEPAPVNSSKDEDVATPSETPAGTGPDSGSNTPVPAATSDESANPEAKDKKVLKVVFKSEDHPIFIYRCFLLNCLGELLGSYNRTKVEFINFKRSAPPVQASTPIKPRSSILHYLINDFLCQGQLSGNNDNLAAKKKAAISTHAQRVLVALIMKTGEKSFDKSVPRFEYDENEDDLLFVRRFVIDTIIKAYEKPSTPDESLDSRYARMQRLAELMTTMIGEREPGTKDALSRPPDWTSRQWAQIRRMMYEKGYLDKLTASIAEIDLSYPGVKRAIKYILRVLKTLTNTAKELSRSNIIPSTSLPEQFEDEILSDSSGSDSDNDREETPDLYRNSALGMLEPRDDDDDESEDEDEEMYDDEYPDEMEYAEDEESSEDDNVSEDDEEELNEIVQMDGLHGDMIADDDDDEEDEEDEDAEIDDDMDEIEDDHNHVEIVDEEGNPVDDHEDWESHSEDDDQDEVGHELDYEEAAQAIDEEERQTGNLILRTVLENPNFEADLVEMGEQYPEEGQDEDDEEEDEAENEDEEYGFEEDMGHPEGRPPIPHNINWDIMVQDPFAAAQEGARIGGHARPNHRSPFPPAFLVGPYRDTPGSLPGYFARMAHRPGSSSNPDDGVNPLLRRRNTTSEPAQRPNPASSVLGLRLNDVNWSDNPANIINELMEVLPLVQRSGNQRDFQWQITSAPMDMHNHHSASREQRNDRRDGTYAEPMQAVALDAESTFDRYQEEARMIFGNQINDRAFRLSVFILAKLAPGAIELEKKIKAQEADMQRLLEEARKKREEEERLAKEAKEAEEKQEREKKQAEEAAAAAEEAARQAEEAARMATTEEGSSSTDANATSAQNHTADNDNNAATPMEGVETKAEENTTPAATVAPTQDRVVTVIRGEEIDITELGIDPEYLAALPEEFIEEVIAQTVSTRRSQARQEASDPRETDASYQVFLNALPEDMRQEILQQERADQRRREREEQQRRQPVVAGTQQIAVDMDAGSILLTFPPALRQEVLLQQGEALMDQLPPEMAAEARALVERHNTALSSGGFAHRDSDAEAEPYPAAAAARSARRVQTGGTHYPTLPEASTAISTATTTRPGAATTNTKNSRRTVIQMLDKAGIATLLRLMFIQQGPIRQYLFSVLADVCENRQNRLEVMSTVLQILQDGSLDMEAVERSFGQLSIKAKRVREVQKDNEPKTPTLRRTATDPAFNGSISQTASETSPLLIVLQCLDLLVDLCSRNLNTPLLFLTEHEIFTSSLKRNAGKKSKGKDKDNKAHKFAINALLGLLDRDLVIESSGIMTTLADLLNRITLPLLTIERRRREAEEAMIREADPDLVKPAETESGDNKVTTAENPAEGEPTTASASTDPPANAEAATISIGQAASAVENVATSNAASEPLQSTTTTGGGDTRDPETVDAIDNSKDTEEEASPKKPRVIQFPVIPAAQLNLVIRIFVARECNSKTFQNTISTIKNLSTLPGAKQTFGEELVRQARVLSENIVSDLEELLPHIMKAKSGTDIQGVALAKFSPGASEQNKLLRVLTALDHLFDNKKKQQASSQGEEADNSSFGKQDLVVSLYNNSTFSTMWEKLGACLAAIRQRENMLNVATILLPLIESLMVVCKDTAKSAAARQEGSSGKDVVSTTSAPPSTTGQPDSPMADLFFTFTEDHRRILNELVRSNPKLMSGTFALLVKNPNVLEFDNKRNYFNRSVHSRNGGQNRPPFPSLQFSVRRDQIFHDSFRSLFYKSGDEIKFGKLNIRFHGEEGVDAGGVTREWFQALSRQMFDPGYALFTPVSSDRTTFHPNKLSGVNDEHLNFFKFIGRVIGKALYEGRVLECYFSRAVYKRILGKTVSTKDMESFDPDYYKSLVWMLNNDITNIITETFSVEEEIFGANEVYELIPNGSEIAVTEENKQDYVRLIVEHKLLSSVKEQMECFLKGFHDIIPAELISIFNEQELELLISGLPDIDVEDWKSNTEYQNYTPSSPQIQWFWRAVRSFDKEERAKLLQFVTGTSKVPLNGFTALEGMNGVNRFNIHRDYGNKDRLPSSHTCFNQLDLPEYENYESLRSQILKAITAGNDYFGFA